MNNGLVTDLTDTQFLLKSTLVSKAVHEAVMPLVDLKKLVEGTKAERSDEFDIVAQGILNVLCRLSVVSAAGYAKAEQKPTDLVLQGMAVALKQAMDQILANQARLLEEAASDLKQPSNA